MGLAALITVWLSHGSVHLLVVLYSINVFITFCLSQAGMVRHWLKERHTHPKWKRKLLVSWTAFMFTTFILCSVIVLKFHDGGWITLIITASLAVFCIFIKRHYKYTLRLLRRLNSLVDASAIAPEAVLGPVKFDPQGKTAGILINGFNGLGLHT